MPQPEINLIRCRISDLLDNMVSCRSDTVPDSDDPIVAGYSELLREGVELDHPRGIRCRDGVVVMFDGHHRCLASASNGETHVLVACLDGVRSDAILGAAAANRMHGRPMSRADKRRAVVMLLQADVDWPDQKIAAHVGCSRSTVTRCKVEVEGGLKVRIKPSSGSLIPPKTASLTQFEDGEETPEPESTDSEPETCAEPAKTAGFQEVDFRQNPIPDHLLNYWKRRNEPVWAVQNIGGVIKKIGEAVAIGDKLWGRSSLAQAEADLNNAKAALENAIPFVLCPICRGLSIEGCRTCSETGFISEYQEKALQ